MAINQTLNQGFPNLSYQFTDDRGNITQPWYQLLVALWKRTGGGSSTGFVTEINTGQGLTGGPFNGNNPSGTIKLADIDPDSFLANDQTVSATPVPTTLTEFLDALFGTNQGQLLFRGSLQWQSLSPGVSGQVLESGGQDADIAWTTAQAANGVLPMVNGDLPGPSLIATPTGECIGVPI